MSVVGDVSDSACLSQLDLDNEAIVRGACKLADAVVTTLGPRGMCAVVGGPGKKLRVTKDGATVAKNIRLRDPIENMGAEIVRESSLRTADESGDGTTTSAAIARALIVAGMREIRAGRSHTADVDGIQAASSRAADVIRSVSTPITSNDDVMSVATISANGETDIGEIISRAISEIGTEGVITVDESRGFSTTLEVVKGLEFDRGFVSPYFMTNHEKTACILESPLIFITTSRLTQLKPIVPLLEYAHDQGRPLLIVADDIDGEALQGLIINKVRAGLSVCAVRGPEFGDLRISALDDIAAMTGATSVLDMTDSDVLAGDVRIETLLGRCSHAVVTKSSTMLVSCVGDDAVLSKRSNEIREALADPSIDSRSRDILRKRLSRLSGGIAVIHVGGSTESEIGERRDRVDDALSATREAIKFGVVPGGGASLVLASRILKREARDDPGWRTMSQACLAPITAILENACIEPDDVVRRIMVGRSPSVFDVNGRKFVPHSKMSLIDPTAVVLSALANATSAACSILTVGCVSWCDDS